MKTLLRDPRIRRLLAANVTGSIGSGITIFAVPWLLVHQPGGTALYGWVTQVTTVVLFLFMPYYGAWLDRHSRKTFLLAGELFGATATLVMAAWMLLTGRTETWQLVAVYFCGMLYYTLHYPAKFAFVQQVFDRSQYRQLTGLLEVQGQVAMMVAGGLGGFLVGHVDLGWILLLDAATYLTSCALQATIPYRATHLDACTPPANAWRSIAEGARWLAARPALTVFFLASFLPFIAVMVGNYLVPVFVSGTLGADATVFGWGEITFAVGAIVAGLLVPDLTMRRGGVAVVVLMMAVFVVGQALLLAWPTTAAFLAAMLVLGVGNAGTRVARNTVVLHVVPPAVMGRVNIFFAAFDRLGRTVLTATATLLVPLHGARTGFGVLAVAVGAALVLAWTSRRAAAAAEAAARPEGEADPATAAAPAAGPRATPA